MQWKFSNEGKVIFWELGSQMGNFGVDKMIDFELLSYEEQVAIAEENTGLKVDRKPDLFSRDVD